MRQVVLVLLPVLGLGCNRDVAPPAGAAKPTAAVPANEAPRPAAQAPPSDSQSAAALGSVSGTVLETLDSGGYTYLRLQTPNGEIWAAIMQTTVAKGATVTVVNAMPMDGFESKTLKRRFEHIVFGSLAGDSAPAAGQATSAPHAAPIDVKVARAEGTDARTVAEIHAGKATLKDKDVVVRGKIVKYNANILGKNWLHVRDGSGSPDKGDNDLTVTTADAAALGDVVVVRGKVRLDRDFGAGYAYAVMLEDAKLSK